MSYAKIEVIDAAVAVATDSLIADIDTAIADGMLTVSVKNTGAAAFDNFIIQIKAVDGSDWVACADIATPALPVVYVNTALATLAAAATSVFQIDARGLCGVRLYASANTAVTTASVWSNLSRGV
jgi:hypothetical protein